MISEEEYQRRLDLAQAAKGPRDLRRALAGLARPGGASGIRAKPESAEFERARGKAALLRSERSNHILAIFGEAARKGAWTAPRETTTTAVFGSSVLDLREANLPPGESAIRAIAVFGTVEIIVPPGFYVECLGSSILGSFEMDPPARPPSDDATPRLLVDGAAVFGSVEVRERHIGESARAARRRIRKEKRLHRRLYRGR